MAAKNEFLRLASTTTTKVFGDDESLIKAGRLDSLSVTKLVMFLEADFAVDFARVEFEPERFDTVSEIGAVVEESRRSG